MGKSGLLQIRGLAMEKRDSTLGFRQWNGPHGVTEVQVIRAGLEITNEARRGPKPLVQAGARLGPALAYNADIVFARLRLNHPCC
jgi:hypothetical protein